MNSLVGYGLSSDSDSDASGSVKDEDQDAEEEEEEEEEEEATVKKTRNFLLESGSGSASSGSEEEDPDRCSSPHALPQTPASFCRPPLPAPPRLPNKLPSPPLNACADSSVFSNPFRAQAEQELSALQKHVPLTLQAKPSHIGGKRMCVSYRKDGRCRFGIKCKFAHDSDLQTAATPSDCHSSVNEEAPDKAAEEAQSREAKEQEPEGQQGKKRRVGLSNTLIPPKRAMKQYTMQRERERERINTSR